MRLHVEHDLCSGHGRCYAVAPTVYDSDEEGYNVARGETLIVPPEDEDAARQGQRACPEKAIRLVRAAQEAREGAR
jgi:ferredoxin